MWKFFFLFTNTSFRIFHLFYYYFFIYLKNFFCFYFGFFEGQWALILIIRWELIPNIFFCVGHSNTWCEWKGRSGLEYRRVPFDLNMENPNSQLIQSPMEITCRSLLCSSACLIQNSPELKDFCLILFFWIKWETPVLKSSHCLLVWDVKNAQFCFPLEKWDSLFLVSAQPRYQTLSSSQKGISDSFVSENAEALNSECIFSLRTPHSHDSTHFVRTQLTSFKLGYILSDRQRLIPTFRRVKWWECVTKRWI